MAEADGESPQGRLEGFPDLTFENGANSGHWPVKWSERLDSNQRPLSPQNRPDGKNPVKHGFSIVNSLATFRKRSLVFGA